MRYSDPLERWLSLGDDTTFPELAAVRLQIAHAALNKLEAYLRQPNKKTRLHDIGAIDYVVPSQMPGTDVARAEKLYRQLYEICGNGSLYAQDGILALIASSRYSESIPFWLEVLDWSRPRDTFSTQRRIRALAALAYLALHGSRGAETALAQAAQHPNPDVRALAVHYWSRLYTDPDRKLPRRTAQAFQRIAVKDAAFSPRFQARKFLRQRALPVPQDTPGGVYAFKVCFRRAKSVFSRTLELRAEQTLEDLHRAIQAALAWDNDHLYSFFLNHDEAAELYCFSCPQQKDNPPWTHEAVAGELGLVRQRKFLYLFDYGDQHLFEIEVVDIQKQAAPKVKYPRVADRQGEAPSQYHSGDE